MISGNYLGVPVSTLGDIGTNHTELMNAAMPFLLHYMVSHQEHPLNLLAKIFSQIGKNLKVMASKRSSITLSGHMSAVHINLLHQMKNI